MTGGPPAEAPYVVRLCPTCRRAVPAWAPGPPGRSPDRCPRCWALARHRLLALLVARVAETRAAGVVLDVAPSKSMARRLRLPGWNYIGMDLDPSADGRRVNVVASLTDLPLMDRSVDLAVVSHVLEHVPDDRAAMAEVCRVLADGGLGLVQVPSRAGPTDEDVAATAAERTRRFGQADHVRVYGDDLEDRLRDAGLSVVRLGAPDVLPPPAAAAFGLERCEAVWLVGRRGDESEMLLDPDTALADLAPPTLPSLAGAAIADLMTEREAFARRYADLERRYRRLTHLPPFRAALGIRKLVRRGAGQ